MSIHSESQRPRQSVRKRRTDVTRFLEMVRIQPGDCWEWEGARTTRGYGQFKKRQAHRVSHELFVGPVAHDLVVDHLCCNYTCVNPDHLEAVTQAENLRRGRLRREARPKFIPPERWPSCDRLHPASDPRVAWRPDGRSYCLECNKIRSQRKFNLRAMADSMAGSA